MRLSRTLASWLGRSIAKRPRRHAPARLACLLLETRETPTVGSDLLAVTNSAQPIQDLQNVAAAFNLKSSLDFSRSSILFAGQQRSILRIGLTDTANTAATMQSLLATGLYSALTPNQVYTASQGDLREQTPNDPLFSSQYHHTIIKTPQAWDTTTGKPEVVVAILDDGVALTHPDLRANVWINRKETPGDSIDNDGNGFTDDVNGWNFIGSNNNVNPTDPLADRHGTQVAGLLAGQFNNGEGVAGVAGGIQFMPLKVVGTGGTTDAATLASAISYAVANGAKIINTSINVDPFADNAIFQAALALAYERDVLLVNSAGNQNIDNPARASLDELLIVAATDRNDIKTAYSNFGSGIDIAAPGGTADDGLITAIPISGYEGGFGTSMSAPLVAGTAALVWSAFPNYSRDQVAAAVLANADGIALKNPNLIDKLGSGRVNAARAVSGAKIVTGLGKLTGLPAEGSEAPAALTTFNLRLKSPLDAGTVTTSNFELRWAGPDNGFGNSDDQLIPFTINEDREYKIGTNDLKFDVNRNLERGLYRFTAKSGGLRDPFGTAIDGDGNGVAGGNLVRNFGVAYPVSGVIYTDIQNDGLRSSTDPGQSGVEVFADLNNNGQLDRATFSTLGGELIADPGTNFLVIPVSGISTVVGGLTVTVHVTHSQLSDLSMTLIAPDGTRVLLFDRREIGESNSSIGRSFSFEDGAVESSESQATSSFNRLAPIEPLSRLIGRQASGDWVIEVTDHVPGNSGTLDGGTITFANEPTAISDLSGFFAFENLPTELVRINLVDTTEHVRAANGGFLTIDALNPQTFPVEIGVFPRAGITGRVLRDTGSGTFAGAIGLANATVFLDNNLNGQADSGEATALTDAFGNYVLGNLLPGFHRVSLIVPPSMAAIPGIPTSQDVSISLGDPSRAGVDFLLQTNTAPATATLMDVLPRFRNSPVDSVTINLSEPLANLSPSSLTLTRDNVAIPLDGTTLLGSGTRYQILGLGNFTSITGNYRLLLNAPAPDGSPNRKPDLDAIEWTTDADSPILTMTGIVENLQVKGVTISSNEPLSSFNLNALTLTANEKPVAISGSDVLVSADGASYTILFPTAALNVPNPIRVMLVGANSGIQDLAGNEFAGNLNFGFQKPVTTVPPGIPITRTVVGLDVGGPPVVNVYDGTSNILLASLPIFEMDFTGGVRVAAGDVNGDGVEDIIAAAGPGGGPRVRVIDGMTFLTLADLNAFEDTFQGGVFVSCGDFTGDGKAELVLSADRGGGPRVRVIDLATNTTLHDFFAIEDANFRGGSRTAVGDINRDGKADLVVAAGFGGGPRIATYDGSRLGTDQRKLTGDFFAFDPDLRNGTFLAVGDLNLDGFADLAFGSGAGGGPRVQVLSGQELATTGQLSPMADFFAGNPGTRSGIRLAIKSTGLTGAPELYTADGTGVGSRIRNYTQQALAADVPSPTEEFDAFDQFLGGIFVG